MFYRESSSQILDAIIRLINVNLYQLYIFINNPVFAINFYMYIRQIIGIYFYIFATFKIHFHRFLIYL